MLIEQKQKKLVHLFEEKYLINLHDSEGFMDKAATALNPLVSKTDSYKKALHDNNASGPWNQEQIKIAEEAEIDIKNVANETRNDLKDALWNLPGKIGRKLLRGLSKPILLTPPKIWTKITQIPGNLGSLAISATLAGWKQVVNVVDYPARLMTRLNKKVQSMLGEEDGQNPHPPSH